MNLSKISDLQTTDAEESAFQGPLSKTVIPYDSRYAEGTDTITVEDFYEPFHPRKSYLFEYKSMPQAFLGLYVMAVSALFCLLYWYSPMAQYLGAKPDQVFEGGQYWRLVTAVFVHADFAHFLSNFVLFLIFSWHLQAFGGLVIFPLLSLVAAVGTHVLSLLTYPDNVSLIGASGMVYAMVGQWLLYYMVFENRYSFLGKLMRAFGFSLMVLMPSTITENVSYRAHGIGFAVGAAIALVSLPWIRKKMNR